MVTRHDADAVCLTIFAPNGMSFATDVRRLDPALTDDAIHWFVEGR